MGGLVARFVISSKHLPLAAWLRYRGACTGHPYLHAWDELGRAIRTRNTNSPNTINYFPRNILSFCFTSNYRPPIVPFQPLSTDLTRPHHLGSLLCTWPHHTHAFTPLREYLCYLYIGMYIRRGTFIPPKSIIPVNIAVHVRLAMEITNT